MVEMTLEMTSEMNGGRLRLKKDKGDIQEGEWWCGRLESSGRGAMTVDSDVVTHDKWEVVRVVASGDIMQEGRRLDEDLV
jgi:predicted PP-loop superfamily ATPase